MFRYPVYDMVPLKISGNRQYSSVRHVVFFPEIPQVIWSEYRDGLRKPQRSSPQIGARIEALTHQIEDAAHRLVVTPPDLLQLHVTHLLKFTLRKRRVA